MTAVMPASAAPMHTPSATRVAAAPRQRGFSFGKYREIIIAVGFFLLFDLGVLVLNFYTSFKIDQDTVAINLAGRQRYVSQRIARTLLELDAARAAGLPYKPETLAELRNGTKIFDISNTAFREGGTIPGGDGKPVYLEAVTSERGLALGSQVTALWKPYYERLQPLMVDSFTPGQLAGALAYSQANNIRLLNTANDFVTETQAIGGSRASTLRMVQTGGILLALLNFAFILFKFLGRLKTSDAAIEAANEENREILTSVREGLFLLTPDSKLGSQVSSSAHTLFGSTLAPGDDFFALLSPLVSAKALTDARDYVDLLFAPHVKEALVQGINPLSNVEVAVRNRLGQDQRRYLSFHFNRVQEGGTVRHLLVTVQDITARMELETKLMDERQRSQKEFSMLLRAFDADPAMLRQFVARAEAGLLEVNDLLRSTSSATSEAAILKAINDACRRVHAIKGDAGTLGLDTLAAQAHAFETELQRIREPGGRNVGDALLALPMPLEDLLNKVAALKGLTGIQRAGAADAASGERINEQITRLLQGVAADSGKQVEPVVRMGSQDDLEPGVRDLLREIAVQLARNAVAHGIESPATRTASGKDAKGRVDVQLVRNEADWTLSVRDDGRGLAAASVRARLIELGWYTAAQLESFDDKQVIAHIFKPGFSTAESLTLHAGRGIGLDVVQANVQRLGARMMLSSTPGQFTEFKIRFSG